MLSHELDLKIARKQAQLSQRGIWIGLAGTLVGAVLGAAATVFFSSIADQSSAKVEQHAVETVKSTKAQIEEKP